jgi:NADPH:quinone reductase-like Zn-dependent oxidoreductase
VKAAVIRRFGGPEALELLDWPDPVPGPRDVVIAVRAVSVGRTLDVGVRAHGADFGAELPRILGSDPAGVIAAVGDEVSDLKLGDRVVATSSLYCGECEFCAAGLENACIEHGIVGVHIDGGDAELCRVPARIVQRIPDHVAFDQAAAMAVTYPVAWNLLKYAGRCQQGDAVLVMGAGGGLGGAGVLVAKALGARVIAAAGSDWKLERCRDLLGADATVNYSRPGWGDAVRAASEGELGVALVFENISDPELFGVALGTLRKYGRLVTCGTHGGGGTVPVNLRTLYRNHLAIIGEVGATQAMIDEVFRAVADGLLAPPPVFHRFPLEEIRAAHEAAAGRDLFGRVVLMIRQPE